MIEFDYQKFTDPLDAGTSYFDHQLRKRILRVTRILVIHSENVFLSRKSVFKFLPESKFTLLFRPKGLPKYGLRYLREQEGFSRYESEITVLGYTEPYGFSAYEFAKRLSGRRGVPKV